MTRSAGSTGFHDCLVHGNTSIIVVVVVVVVVVAAAAAAAAEIRLYRNVNR